MSDETVAQPALDESLIEPQTVPATPAAVSGEKPVRRRKSRAKGAAAAALDAFEDAGGDELTAPKPTRTRASRSAKLSGDDVSGAVELATSLYAMMTKQAHWTIPASESKAWAGDAAALLNKIPSRYVRAATDLSGYATVAIGIYGSVKPRLDYSADLRREAAAIKRAEAMQSTQVDPLANPVETWGPGD